MALVNNAIGWANFQMSGGLRRTAWLCGGVAIVLPLMMFGTSHIDDGTNSVARALRGWYVILGIIQGGLLLVGMPSRVHGAIKRDRITAKILESHRLMPVRPVEAVVGYIVGPNLLVGAVVATIFLIGLFVATLAGQDWRGWVAMHVAAAGLCASLCCLVAFMSQWLPRLNVGLLLTFAVPILGISGIFAVVPGLRVMFAPFFKNLPELQHGEVNVGHVVAAASQLAFAVILFVGASRRYRRDDVPTLGFAWGLALLALWVGVTLIGTLNPEVFTAGFYAEDRMVTISYVVSTALAMVLAIGPIASAATARLTWRERKRIDPYFDERSTTPIWLATLGVIVVLCALLWAAPTVLDVPRWMHRMKVSTQPTWQHYALDGSVIATFGVTVAMLAHAAGRLHLPAAAAIGIWVMLTWVIPPIADGIGVAMQAHGERFPRPLGAVSPPFALTAIWIGDVNAAVAGLIAQAAAIPLLFLVWQLIKRRNRASATPPALPLAIANG